MTTLTIYKLVIFALVITIIILMTIIDNLQEKIHYLENDKIKQYKYIIHELYQSTKKKGGK